MPEGLLRSLSSYMTAGSSGIMIDAPGWHLGFLLLFGALPGEGRAGLGTGRALGAV